MKVSLDYIKMRGRRQFLRAAGGGLLAVPLLESLLPREAHSQAAGRPKLFVQMATSHGGVWWEDMFPAESTLTESSDYAGRSIRRGDLVPASVDARSVLSPVLSASSARLTPSIASKMNVIAGFDVPYYLGHHHGGHMGNFAANDGGTGDATPTIDQVMAYSSSFYPDLGGILRRSLHLSGNGRDLSWTYANPETQSGEIQPIVPTTDTQQVFDSIFVETTTDAPTRTPVVDRVYESYQRLVQSNRRLGSSDRRRLEEHMARLQEIQRRASVVVDCSAVEAPTGNASDVYGWPGPQGVANSIEAFRLINDVIVAAFLCGTSRIAVVGAHDHAYALFSDYVGDWHEVAHLASTGAQPTDEARDAEAWLRDGTQGFFEHAFMDLVSKLDTDNGAGGSLLDDALVVWTQESCHLTHNSFSVPIITAGSAGGALRTGSYIDYRNMAIESPVDVGQTYNPGLLWNQWLGTVLQATGVSPSEYETAKYQPSRPAGASTGGYGPIYLATEGWVQQKPEYYTEAMGTPLSEIPPYLRGA